MPQWISALWFIYIPRFFVAVQLRIRLYNALDDIELFDEYLMI